MCILILLILLCVLLFRGFGFVTYAEQAGVEKVLAQNRHELDSKTVSSTFLKKLDAASELSWVTFPKFGAACFFFFLSP